MASQLQDFSPMVSFGHPYLKIEDEITRDQRAGFLKQELTRERGQLPALLPPHSTENAPQTSLLERLRQRADLRSLRLRFMNSYPRGVWFAVGYHRPGCPDGGDWAKKGWYRLEPGQSAFILDTNNRFATFFAEADDGAFWGGEFVTNVPIQAFDWCWNTASSTGENVGMRLIEVGTINLVA